MNDLFIPIGLAIVGLVMALAAYRGIRRGGARLYTLEREAMLRRASFTLIGSVFFFLAAIGFLLYQQQQSLEAEAAASGEAVEGVVTSTPTPEIQTFPPTSSPTATLNPLAPTPTATPVICRASIEETGGTGLTLRDSPGGEEIRILAEGSIITLLEDEPVETNNFIWRKVRVIGGEEGWVAQDFLRIAAPCQ